MLEIVARLGLLANLTVEELQLGAETEGGCDTRTFEKLHARGVEQVQPGGIPVVISKTAQRNTAGFGRRSPASFDSFLALIDPLLSFPCERFCPNDARRCGVSGVIGDDESLGSSAALLP
jgi:hypothetical protein